MAYITRSLRDDLSNPLLFVYGTLRRGSKHPEARQLAKRAKWLGLADYQGLLFDIGPYPGAIPSANRADTIRGDLYRLFNPGQSLPHFDRYEQFGDDFPQPNEFVRVPQTVLLRKVPRLAWIYLYNHPTEHLPLLGSDYLAHPHD